MKLLFNKDGFIFRNDQKKLISELGLSLPQFRRIMEDGLGADNLSLSIYEAKQIISWLEKNNYILEEPKSWVTIFADTDDEREVSLRALRRIDDQFTFRKVEWYDEESGFGKFEVEDILKERLSLWFKCNPTSSKETSE